MSNHQSPIACDLTSLTEQQRERHQVVGQQLFDAVQEIQELPDGYAFRLPSEPELLQAAANFIAMEQLCCPFYDFTLKVEREGGPMWLWLAGREGVKEFLQEELLSLEIGSMGSE